MNQDLQNQILQLLAQVQNATDFASAHLPEVVADYLLIGRVVETCAMLLGVVLMALGVFCIYNTRVALRDEYSVDAVEVLWVAGAGIGLLLGLLVAVIAFSNFVAVWFMPKVYLLETLARLIR